MSAESGHVWSGCSGHADFTTGTMKKKFRTNRRQDWFRSCSGDEESVLLLEFGGSLQFFWAICYVFSGVGEDCRACCLTVFSVAKRTKRPVDHRIRIKRKASYS